MGSLHGADETWQFASPSISNLRERERKGERKRNGEMGGGRIRKREGGRERERMPKTEATDFLQLNVGSEI